MKRRSPNLTPERVEAIVTMVRAWEGRLTWPMLIRAAEDRLGCAYTRTGPVQAQSHPRRV